MLQAIKYYAKTLTNEKYIYLNKFKIRTGDIMIDLGANIGEVTEFFARKKANVFAYEPNPFAYQALNTKFSNWTNITLNKTAVSNYSGEGKLWLHDNHTESEVKYSQGSSLLKEKGNVSSDFKTVQVTHIKTILDKHKSIRVIKIDIEGGEYDIIDDILENLDKIDIVLLEMHGEKHPIFESKEKDLLQKINTHPHKNKIYTDWF